jgi:hypothetical protein
VTFGKAKYHNGHSADERERERNREREREAEGGAIISSVSRRVYNISI